MPLTGGRINGGVKTLMDGDIQIVLAIQIYDGRTLSTARALPLVKRVLLLTMTLKHVNMQTIV